MNKKSHITGIGYGSKHIWKNLGSKQLPYYATSEEKCTKYKCRVCGELFFHYYGIKSDIFEAMESAKIKENCL
jgi:hypothetical protein